MEYASAVWDPYYNSQIQQLEKVQRRAARWIYNDYSRFSSVSAMLNEFYPFHLLRLIARYLDYKSCTRHSITSLPSAYHHITYHQREKLDHTIHCIS